MVTTLADLIYATPRRFSYQIRINGVLLTPSSQATALAELTGVPGVVGFGWDEATAHIDVNRCPNWMRAGMSVTIDAGFNNLNMRVFTGFIVALPGEDPDYLRDKVIVRGSTIQVGTPPDDVPVEQKATASLVGADIQPPLPVGTHIEHEIPVPMVSDPDRLAALALLAIEEFGVVPRRPSGDPSKQTILCGGELYKAARAYQLDEISLDGFTDEDAINLICDLVGITKRKLIEPSFGWYLLDVGSRAKRGRPLDMLQELMKIGWLQAYHSEDGTVIFRQVRSAPGPSHAWEYDVQDQALARVLSMTGEVEVTFNPLVRKFSTGLLNAPYLGFNSARVFTRRVRHEATRDGPKTYIDAWGGSRLGGTLEQDPFAAFTFQVDREVMGTAVYLVYSVDASASFDPDGSIASYAWTCNRTTTPAALPATKIMQFRVLATVTTPLTLTLTVTDNEANTGTLAIDLPTAADDPAMQIPAIFAALETRMSASPDGGSNWNDIAALSGDEVSVDAKPADGVNSGIACYGYTDGSIKRTTDFALTSTTVLAADAANGTILEVWWDKNVTTRVWAGTSTGRLLRSDDDGVTWAVHKDFGSSEPIYRIATPLGGNSVWVFGGRGDSTSTLMRYQFDVGGVGGGTAFVSIAVGGELATALVGAASALHVRSAASRQDGELVILLNGTVPAGSQDNIFRTATVHDPLGAGWVAATGLTAGLTDGREIVPDAAPGTFRAFFGNQSVWNTVDGVAFTETTNVLPAGVTPNRVLWLGDYTGHAGTYLIAAENAGHTVGIYKWLASEATADVLRPATGFATWPASADGRGIAIGAAAIGGGGGLYVHRQGSTDAQSEPRIVRLGGTNYVPVATVAADAAAYRSFKHLQTSSGAFFFRIKVSGDNVGQLQRSPDCVTWTNVGPAPSQDLDLDWGGAYDIVATPSGDLYLLDGNNSSSTAADARALRIYKSSDGGASFVQVYTNTSTGTGGSIIQVKSITSHPTDGDIVVAQGDILGTSSDKYPRTENGGSLWTTATGVSDAGIVLLSNNRLIVSEMSGVIKYSDDWGATWTTAKQLDGTTDATLTGAIGVTQIVGGAGYAYVLATSAGSRIELWRSVNGGTKWEQIYEENAHSRASGMIYVAAEDALYIWTVSTSTGRIYRLTNPSQATAEVTLEDVTYNIDTAFTVSGDSGGEQVGGMTY